MDIDVILNITESTNKQQLGHRSIYTEKPHPGTGKLIQGWKWGEFQWPVYSKLSESSYIPTLFDSNAKNFPYKIFQSGYGYGTDIELKEINEIEGSVKKWIPKIKTGTYYIYNKEWYLFSDEYITEVLNVSNNYHNLGTKHKSLTPIFIRNYKRDDNNSQLLVNQELVYKINLVTDNAGNTSIEDPSVGEFSLDSESPDVPRLKINPADQSLSSEEFSFSVEVGTTAIELPVFPVASTTASADWTLDPDLGVLKRVNSATDGLDGTSVTIQYTPQMFVIYEPHFSSGLISAKHADTNPVSVGTNQGFVQITTEILDPASITLEADLSLLNPSDLESHDYLINLGNNVGKLKATVKNKVGSLLEGVRVYFDWEGQPNVYGQNYDPPQDPSSITDSNGIAYMSYSSPSTIDDVGVYIPIDDVSVVGTFSYLDVEGYAPSTNSGVSIYEVRHDDNYYGRKASDIAAEYSNYFTEEGITDHTADIGYEESYRLQINSSLNYPEERPISLDITDASENRGQKRMLFVSDTSSNYMHPNTGARSDVSNPVYAPLRPEEINDNSDGTYSLRYDAMLNAANNSEVYRYFVVSNKKIKARAWARNAAGQKVISNEITINIMLPDSINGTYYTNALNEIPNHYKERLLRAASTVSDTEPQVVPIGTADAEGNYTAPDNLEASIPLGFRIRDSGITVAALLDQVTFLTKEN